MDKKGIQWVGEETGKIIIAVLVIIGLIGLVAVLLNLGVKTNKSIQAQSMLDSIATTALRTDRGKMENIVYLYPRDWTMRFYKERKEGMSQCGNGKCFCLCENFDCSVEDKYVCKAFADDIEILSTSGANWIRFNKIPITLTIKRTSSGLIVEENR